LDEVVRIDRQTVPADPGARIIDVEILVGCSGTYHVHDIDMQAFEDQGVSTFTRASRRAAS
jgi:hypothetical protein